MHAQSFLTSLQTEKFFGKTVRSNRDLGAKFFRRAFLGARSSTATLHRRFEVVVVLACATDHLPTFVLEFISANSSLVFASFPMCDRFRDGLLFMDRR